MHMINDDYCTTGELDDAIRFGFGIRWSFFGMYMIYHMAGGDAGMRHFLAQFGPALELPWTHLKAPPLTDSIIDKIVDGTEKQAGSHSIKELERLRDDCIIDVIAAITKAKAKHGWKYED
jgi:carnitine 3-dehydrogenase